MNQNNNKTPIDIAHDLSIDIMNIINGTSQSNLNEFDFHSFNEIDILKYLGNFLKITPDNIEDIEKISNFSPELEKACLLYNEIIENCEIEQVNFMNIFILDYLLTKLTIENAELYSIYSNLFLRGIDITSFYQIIINHCHGMPNSIFELATFVKYCNDINDNTKIIREIYLDFAHENLSRKKWEIGVFGFYLYYYEILGKNDLILYYDFYWLDQLNEKIFNDKDSFLEQLKGRDFKDIYFKCILNDDADTFCRLSSNESFDFDGYIRKPKDLLYDDSDITFISECAYWPFEEDQISYIDLSAFLGSLKVFKFLLLNHANYYRNLLNYAIAGGNLEIIHICQQIGCEINSDSFSMAICYYHLDIFIWLMDNNPDFVKKKFISILRNTILYSNAKAFLILYQTEYDLSNIVLFSFHFINREWLKFFISINENDQFINFNDRYFIQTIFDFRNSKSFQILYDEYKENMRITFDIINASMDVFYKFNDGHAKSIKFYLKEIGEIQKCKNEMIFPPFPDEFVLEKIKLYSLFNSRDVLIYLAKNNAYDLSDLLKESKLCYNCIYYDDFKGLDILLKYRPNIKNLVYDDIFGNDWLKFIKCKDSKLKNYFFQHILSDEPSKFALQNEGLHYACFFGDSLIVENLLTRTFIDVNSNAFTNGRTPLILATGSNFVKIVDLLLKNDKVDVNAFSNDHKTSFYLACEYNYVDIVDLFLKNKNVDLNIPDKDGKTPLFIACERGNHKVVERILSKTGVDLNLLTKQGSAFGIAVENWHYKVVGLLLNDKRIDLKFENEINPLQRACLRGTLKMVELLFSNDSINKNVIDDKGVFLYIDFIEIFCI